MHVAVSSLPPSSVLYLSIYLSRFSLSLYVYLYTHSLSLELYIYIFTYTLSLSLYIYIYIYSPYTHLSPFSYFSLSQTDCSLSVSLSLSPCLFLSFVYSSAILLLVSSSLFKVLAAASSGMSTGTSFVF